jgi:exodeoxyribonuclease VII large subunit
MTIGFTFKKDDLARDILTVTELNRTVAELLERHVPMVSVSGEISNFTLAASGHWYFTLKDSRASVRAVMFRGRAVGVGFVPRAGDRVEVRARVSLYEPRGDYQLQVEAMRRAGVGNLYEAFLRLKEKLNAEGLFDPGRKRTPVRLPRAIGVVTSPHAAALRDVLSALARRAPQVPVILYPAPVQGADSAARLAAQVTQANRRAEVDTLLLVRGGGSIEDLWSFNDETLAREVAASAIPVISGVGHETDFTIVDFVADLRAPTPTAAAELACVPRQDLYSAAAQLVSPGQRLAHQQERLASLRHRLTALWNAPQGRRHARLDLALARLAHRAPDVERAHDHVRVLARELARAHALLLQRQRVRVAAAATHLRTLDPRQALARGFTLARDEHGGIVRDAARLSAGQRLSLEFARGTAVAQVLEAAPADDRDG